MSSEVIRKNQAQRKVCREMLRGMFNGPNGPLMRVFLHDLLELGEIRAQAPLDTYFNLGKREAFKLILDEAEFDYDS